MSRRRSGTVTLAALLLLGAPLVADASRFRGEPLSDALARLRRLGLKIVFTSEVVEPGMRVETEPASTEPRAILDELLAPHGLEARDGPRGTLVVLRREEAASRSALTGRVVLGAANDPVPGAVIRIVESGARAVSEADGRFVVPDHAAGRFTVEIGRAGFAIERRDVELASGETTEVIVRLSSAAVAETLVVTPSRVSLLREDPGATIGLGREEIQALPHLGDDFFRAVPLLPGVTANDVSARFHVRGARTDEVQVLLDGQELFEAYHLKDFDSALSFVPSSRLASADLSTGGFSAEYGDRMSGVLNMTTETPGGAPHGQVVLGLLYLSAGGSGGFSSDRGTWLVEARRGTADLIGDLIDETSPEYGDAYAKLAYQLDPRNSLQLNALVSRDDFDLAEDDGTESKRNDTEYRSSYLWLTHRLILGQRTIVETAASLTGIEQDRRGTEIEEDQQFAVRDIRDTRVLGIRQSWAHRAGERHVLRWGFEARGLDTEYDYLAAFAFDNPLSEIRDDPGPGTTVFDEEVDGTHRTVWVTDRADLGETVRLELGLRYEDYSWTDESHASPRASVAVAADANTVFRASWGRYLQSQRPYELDVQDGETELQSTERSDHRILGLERLFPRALAGGMTLRAEVYERRVSNPRPRYENLYEALNVFPEVEPDRVRIAPSDSVARGVELYVQGRVGPRLGFWANYALASTDDELDDGTAPRSVDQTHALNANLDARVGAWRLDLAWRYHTGWPTTPLSLSPEIDDDGAIVYVPVLGPLNSDRVKDYHRLDLRASRVFRLRKDELELFVDVQNVYDRQNVAGFDYQIDDEAGTIDAEVEYWTGILPSAGVTYRF